MVNDKFGHQMIYASKPSGEIYEIPSSNLDDDNRYRGNSPSGNNRDGYTVSGNDQVRINFLTSSRYGGEGAELDHSVTANRGYVWKSNDWRNCEFTAYVYAEQSSSDSDIVLGLRGARHTGSGDRGCEGTTYKVAIDIDSGEVRFRKEQRHPSDYVNKSWKTGTGGSILRKWIGFKFVTYNLNDNKHTKLECWLDANNNNQFKKVYEITDANDWGDGSYCDWIRNGAITWGGPWALLRWDGPRVRFRDVVVRELAMPVTTNFNEPGGTPPTDPGAPPPGPAPEEPVPPPPTNTNPEGSIIRTKYFDFVWNINFDLGDSCQITGPVEQQDLIEIYNVNATDNYFNLYSNSLNRVGLYVNQSWSAMLNKRVRQVQVTMKKNGNPTGDIFCRIYGSSGSSTIENQTPYSVTQSGTNERDLDSEHLTRGIYIESGSSLIGKTISELKVMMRKENSPTGNIYCTIRGEPWDGDPTPGYGTLLQQMDTVIDATTLTTSHVQYTFTKTNATHKLRAGDIINIAAHGTDATNKIFIANNNNNPYAGAHLRAWNRINKVYDIFEGIDMAATLRTAAQTVISNETLKATIGTIAAATLTNIDATYTFENLSNQILLAHKDKVYIEYTGGDASNNIELKIAANDPFDGVGTTLIRRSADGSQDTSGSYDFAGKISG